MLARARRACVAGLRVLSVGLRPGCVRARVCQAWAWAWCCESVLCGPGPVLAPRWCIGDITVLLIADITTDPNDPIDPIL